MVNVTKAPLRVSLGAGLARTVPYGHTPPMAERTIKSLYHTGRISRVAAREVAKRLRAEMTPDTLKRKVGKIRTSTTASGRGAISFHVVFPKVNERSATDGLLI